MVQPNYSFAKRQRDIAKKQKNEAKRQMKADAKRQPAQNESLPGAPVDEAAGDQPSEV